MNRSPRAVRTPEFDRLLTRVRGTYDEMPGLWLTIPQLARLCGIEAGASSDVVAALLADHFLRMAANGKYGRADALP
jgi:hypothetical protein